MRTPVGVVVTDAPEESTSDANKIVGIAKLVIELGTLWMVFGYVSVRAFCNHLGVAPIADLPIARYFEETYSLLVTLALQMLNSLWFLLIIVIACLVVGIAIVRRRRPEPARAHLAWVRSALPWMLVASVLINAAGLGIVNRFFSRLPESVLSGHLQADRLQDDGFAAFYGALIVALFGCVACSLLRPKRLFTPTPALERSVRVLFAILCVLSGLEILYVPIAYGVSLHGKEFYVVRLQLDGNTPAVCGARIFESPQRILLWSADNRIGHSQSIALSKVTRADYLGSYPLSYLAERAAQSSAPQPTCQLPASSEQRP